MTLQEVLAALLNPGGQQAPNQLAMAGAPARVGDHANPALLPGMQQPQAPQQAFAPPQAPQGQPMPQSAPEAPPMAAPPSSGGGIGGFLSNLLQGPQAAQKNQTIDWLKKQGMDDGTATMFASSKPALQQYLLQRSQGGGRPKPIEINGRLVDPTDFHVIADFSTPKERKIQNDANGTPRFVDTGEPVYPGDQSTGKEMFTGKGIEAQGLNYLIAQNKLTKEQAANVAAGKPVTGPNGEIIFMTPQGIFQQLPGGGAPQPVQPGGADTPGGNIPITGPKYSEDMRKAGGFALRADAADKIVSDPKVTAAGGSLGQNLKNDAPFGLGNYLTSDDFQSFDQAQRDFVNAVLRRESGAAISESEFQNARKQYLPAPGDGKTVLDQKAANRKLAIQSLQSSADPVPALSGGTPGASAGPPSFTGNKDVFDAIQAGKLKIGDEIIVNGKRMRVDP